MEARVPMLNCLLQHTLKSLCSCPGSSEWVYAVFWRILPRNYPPPKWEYGGGALDRSKGNKRNWILVWEDGFCDLLECKAKEGFGADTFFKMSHEVYNYGEGLVGKVAADHSHRWVFRETDPNFIPSWNVTTEPLPKVWELQFNSGIQTIAIISVREGLIQLGSFHKVVEDLHMVISTQRKLGYLQSIPQGFAIQRPYLPLQHPYILNPNNHVEEIKYSNLGWNSPQNGAPCNLGALLSKLPPVMPSYNSLEVPDYDSTNMNGTRSIVKVDGGEKVCVKVEPSCQSDAAQKDKTLSTFINLSFGLEEIPM